MDSKLSEFPVATVLAAVDYVPLLQSSANKICTLGQIKTFTNTPVVSTVVSGLIPVTSNVVSVSGDCGLPVGTVQGTKIIVVAVASGRLISMGLLPSNGFTFASTNTCELVWLGSVWNILSVSGMVTGI